MLVLLLKSVNLNLVGSDDDELSPCCCCWEAEEEEDEDATVREMVLSSTCLECLGRTNIDLNVDEMVDKRDMIALLVCCGCCG